MESVISAVDFPSPDVERAPSDTMRRRSGRDRAIPRVLSQAARFDQGEEPAEVEKGYRRGGFVQIPGHRLDSSASSDSWRPPRRAAAMAPRSVATAIRPSHSA